MNFIVNIVTYWREYSIAGVVGLVLSLLALLKSKDSKIGQLQAKVLEQRLNANIQQIDSQVEVHQSDSVDSAKKEFENAKVGLNLPLN